MPVTVTEETHTQKTFAGRPSLRTDLGGATECTEDGQMYVRQAQSKLKFLQTRFSIYKHMNAKNNKLILPIRCWRAILDKNRITMFFNSASGS
jgi:hypothetical protein